MHSRTLKFEYPLIAIKEPIFSSLVKRFDVAPNILGADIDPSRGGWLVVELLGDAEQIGQAVAWTAGHGITVTDYVIPAA